VPNDSAEPLIGVINAGSSSLKFSFYDGERRLLSGQVDGIGVRPAAQAVGHRSLIAVWAVKPSVQCLSGDECPCRVMVLSAVGVSRRMMVSEAPAS
jgi:hypothetical protein